VTIYTCSYSEFDKHQDDVAGLVPIRASVGYPRFRKPYMTRMGYCRDVTPRSSYLRAPYEEFLTAFTAQLDAAGAAGINQALAKEARDHGGQHPVVLCFEDLGNPTNYCHRRLFADWWLTQTGEEVIELGRLYVPPTGGTMADATLFDDISDGA
jgi:hypothetical protein